MARTFGAATDLCWCVAAEQLERDWSGIGLKLGSPNKSRSCLGSCDYSTTALNASYPWLCAWSCLGQRSSGFGGRADMRVTRGTCDILNYSRKGKAGRNNCSCDILKGKEEECAKLHKIALLHWELLLLHPPTHSFKNWWQTRAIQSKNLAQFSSVCLKFPLLRPDGQIPTL